MMPSASSAALTLPSTLLVFRSKMTDRGVLAVGDEPAAGAGDDGDAVVPPLAGDVGHGLAAGGVKHHRVGAAGDVEQLLLGIDGQVVPAASAADVEGLGDAIGTGGRAWRRRRLRLGKRPGDDDKG